MKNVENIIWHDGVLVETRMECHHTEYNFILTAELYVDEFTAGRERKGSSLQEWNIYRRLWILLNL